MRRNTERKTDKNRSGKEVQEADRVRETGRKNQKSEQQEIAKLLYGINAVDLGVHAMSWFLLEAWFLPELRTCSQVLQAS